MIEVVYGHAVHQGQTIRKRLLGQYVDQIVLDEAGATSRLGQPGQFVALVRSQCSLIDNREIYDLDDVVSKSHYSQDQCSCSDYIVQALG